jgi:pimeloyl-ACP methyl ester carboxylesterase
LEVKIPNKKMKKKASILFVHGAGHAAWCWRDHFTGWFEALGYTVAAPDLPHHGDLNRDGLKFTPLSAYVDAVAQEAVRLEPPLILIGHSMGGFIIQKYLERAEADLAVLVASTPPTGAFGMVKRMATRRPVAFFNTMRTGNGTDSPARTRDYFFNPETPADVVNRCHQRLQPESMRALMDMMSSLHPERVRTPVVVIGAECDWLVAPPNDLETTARAYHTTPLILPGGHTMMLDTAWEQVAREIETAIVERVPIGG